MPLRLNSAALVWACCLARLAFYATATPLWEGYDEWAHFSVIRVMASNARPLVARDEPVPADVEASIDIAPVPWSYRDLPPPAVTHDAFWNLAPEDRAQREAALQALPSARRPGASPRFTAYEALQPPLYYWLMTPVAALLRARPLATQVLVLRWCAIFIASLAVPLLYQIAVRLFGDRRLALACAATAALMPEFAIDVARVGNECLGILLFTLLLRAGLDQRPSPLQTGLLLGLGLLTKAYFLTAIPAVAFLFAWRRRYRDGARALLVAAIVSAWWYLRNLATTGTLSGLSESVMLKDQGIAAVLSRAATLGWKTAIDSILFSHIYFGGWSSLQVRSWMYHLFFAVIGIAAIGLVRVRRLPLLWWPVVMYLAFWAGQLYNVVLLYVTKGLPGSMGWYMYAVIAAEIVICVAGLRRLHPLAAYAGIALFGLLDLYTVHAVALPYYTGIIRHRPAGTLAALHLADFAAVGFTGLFHRLAAFKPGFAGASVLRVLWLAYLCATLALPLIILRSPRNAASVPKPDSR